MAAFIPLLFNFCGSIIYRSFPFPGGDSGQNRFPDYSMLTGQIAGIQIMEDKTYFFECTGGYDTIEKQWKSSGSSMPRKIHKAAKAGVRVRVADSREDWDAYHQLYMANTRYWDPPPRFIYPRRFFDELSSQGPEVKLWLAERKGQLLAGAISLAGKKHLAYWHGASDRRYQQYRAANFLIAKILEWACRAGFHWFDLNPSMGLKGVEEFKKSMGACPAETTVMERRTRFVRMLQYSGSGLNVLRNLFKRDYNS
jgi:predicted N-acyltransferase